MRAANQGGPFELLFYGLPYLIGVTGVVGWFVFYAIALAIVTFGVVLVVLVGAGSVTGRLRFYLALATAALANLGWFVPLAVLTGHPAQLVIPLLWVLAAIAAQQRQFIAVGALIGLATGWELWGMLGVPVILLAARPNLLKAALAGIVTLAVLYLPFVLSGEFHMFEFGWPIIDGTLVSVLWPTLEDFGWGLRLGQGVFVLLVGCGVALAARERFYAPWLVAVAIGTARLVTDPTLYGYYWLAVEIVVLGIAVAFASRRAWLLSGISMLALFALWIYTTKGLVAAIVLLALIIIAAVVVAVQRRRSGSLVLRDAL